MPLRQALFAPLIKQLDNAAKSDEARCDSGVQGFNAMIHWNRTESVSVLSACLRETMGLTAHDVNHALV